MRTRGETECPTNGTGLRCALIRSLVLEKEKQLGKTYLPETLDQKKIIHTVSVMLFVNTLAVKFLGVICCKLAVGNGEI